MAHDIPRTHVSPGEIPAPVLDALAARFRETGVMQFEGVLPADRVAGLLAAYEDAYARYHRDALHADARHVGDKRNMITVEVAGAFNDPMVYANPAVLPLVDALLGSEAILGSFVAVTSLPGARDQECHLDTPPLFGGAGGEAALPPHCLTLVIPLVAMNAENGTTAFFPGSHRDGSLSPPAGGAVAPDVPVGDAVLFDARVWHFGTANRSDAPRPVLYNSYHRPWFRDAVNFGQQPPLTISRAERDRVPGEYRRLFDWRTAATAQ